MQLATPVSFPTSLPKTGYADRVLMMGSCFAQNIGERMQRLKFCLQINPMGILYNPASVAMALRRVAKGVAYTADDVWESGGLWYSFDHHGCFAHQDRDVALSMMNASLQRVHQRLPETTRLFVTFGTSHIYTLVGSGKVCANCHKQPEKMFRRRRLSIEEIVEEWTDLLQHLYVVSPKLKVLFTVSPVRHLKDGLQGNALSKAVLLLSVEELAKRFPERVSYLPIYELFMDELRDYRFYTEDMAHPSALALEYVWQRLQPLLFEPETLKLMSEVEAVGRAVRHRPLHPGTEAHRQFVEKTLQQIAALAAKHPDMDFKNEQEICLTALKK